MYVGRSLDEYLSNVYSHIYNWFIVRFPIMLDSSSQNSFLRRVNEDYKSRIFMTGCPSWRQLVNIY